MLQKIGLVLLLEYAFLAGSLGNVQLPAIFSDNMVLQLGMLVPVWGWGDPGEKVTVDLGGHTGETVTGPDGKWKLRIGPLDAGGPFEMVVHAGNTIRIRNVLVGEVWVCAGQSNMAMEVENCFNANEEIRSADYPQIRHFQVKRVKSRTPLVDVSTASGTSWLNTWEVCSPSTVGHFTGAGYFFSRALHQSQKVPVGMIHTSWGGTTAEAWTPIETLKSDSFLMQILQNWPGYNNDEEWLKEEYAGFLKEVETAKEKHLPEPIYFNEPSVLYNGILAPVIPFGIRGVAWYQGESNAYRAFQYRTLLPALITSWRQHWQQGDFPFLIVQLANYQFEPQVFPELREAQQMALDLPATAMTVSIDIGNPTDIHPQNKQEVGRRLFLAAGEMIYGNGPGSGPRYHSMVISDGKCRLRFTDTGEGLTIPGPSQTADFSVAGTDRVFHPALIKIEGNEVILWSSEVPAPVAVRYAWANHPHDALLYNQVNGKAFLPASPFRTDDWPGLTANRF